MRVLEIISTVYAFEPISCSKCDFRFGCWTSYFTCCPLKLVRLIAYNEKREIIINKLGRFDYSLLIKIGKALDKAYEAQQKS